jgi:peptide/nickel transport system permease protein
MTNQLTSPGLWALAWRRLRGDKVAMVSLAVVALFLAMLVLSSAGLIAADWEREVGVNYAPPSCAPAAWCRTPRLPTPPCPTTPSTRWPTTSRRSARRAGRAPPPRPTCTA